MNRLKGLRRRFIAINMVTITIMLAVILSIIIVGNIQHYRSVAFESLHILVNMTNPVNTLSSDDDRGADRFQDANRDTHQPPHVESSDDDTNDTSAAPDAAPPPQTISGLDAESQKAALSLPGIVVGTTTDYEDAEILFSRNMNTSASTAEKLVQAVQEKGDTEGTLSDYNLAYSVRQTPEGIKIAFVDRSYETSNVKNLVLLCLLGFIIAWLIFLFIVWRLSKWVLRPIEVAWKQQRQFIADASHELKTPLTVILANLRILKNHQNEPIAEQMRWIESSDQEALRMKKLVSDLLLLARNDASEDQPLPQETVDLSDLVTGRLLSFESVALDSGLFIHEKIQPGLALAGDRAQLEELLQILLDNACKYAPPESSIAVTLVQEDKQLHLSVHNKGAALSQDELDHLFERFYRVDASRARQTGGVGLGLAIAASICQRHGGHIRAANEGDGITFHVTLPALSRQKRA